MYFELYQDGSQKWRWSLYTEHKKIADSAESFVDSEQCRRAAIVVMNSATAVIQSPLELLAEYLGAPLRR